MMDGAEVDRLILEDPVRLGEKLASIPDAMKRQVAIESCKLRKLALAGSKVRDQAAAWAEAGDPEKTVRELFGYCSTPDTSRAFSRLESGKLICWGGHSQAKTFLIGAGLFGHYWYAAGSVLADDGRPRGGILVLMGSKAEQIKITSWASIRRHAKTAADRGHIIPGVLAPVDVGWRADPEEPLRWSIISQPFKQPAKASGMRAIQSEAGLKHPYSIWAWVEEGDVVPAPMWETIRGWGARIFLAFNPYTPQPAMQKRMSSPEWTAVRFSILRWPPLVKRDPELMGARPAGSDHLTFEAEMRDPTRCTQLAAAVTPDKALGHFRYALPPVDMPEKSGPRHDGVPGHPDAEPSWYKAGELMMAQRIGLFPPTSELTVFSPIALEMAGRRWLDLGEPSWPPRVVGVDTAEGGPDRIIEIGNFGRDAVDLWIRHQSALARGLSPEEAIVDAERCPDCEGEGCDRCWDGASPLYLGRPRAVLKALDASPDTTARNTTSRYGSGPRYILDEGGGGHFLVQPIQRLECEAESVHFGAEAVQVAGQRGYYNQRARMFGVLSYALLIGAVALPPAALGPLEAELHAALSIPQWIRDERRKAGVFWKLPDKSDISAALSIGSPDVADAAALTGGQGKKESFYW